MPYTQAQTETAFNLMFQQGIDLDIIQDTLNKSRTSIIGKLRYEKMVRQICSERLHRSKPVIKNRGEKKGHCLYIVQCGKFYKIGISCDIKKRISSMQTGNPFPIILIWQSSHNNFIRTLEQEYHAILTKLGKHHRGEWFSMSAQDIENIKKWYDEDKDIPFRMRRLTVGFLQKDRV